MAEVHVAKLSATDRGMAEIGDWIVEFDGCPAGTPAGGAEAFRGLPGDACQAAHLGYLFKGTFRVRFPDGRVQTVSQGEAYYIEPGHTFEAVEDIEYIEFSPAAEQKRTMEVMSRNIAALR